MKLCLPPAYLTWTGCRTSPPDWESIPGLLKRFKDTGSGVQVLPMQDCSQLITTRNYNYVGKNELCAGRKKKFKTIQLFKKEGDKYTAKGNITNFMGK